MIIKKFDDFFEIKNIEDIKKTSPKQTLLFDFDKELLTYCKENDISFAIKTDSILEAVFANNFDAEFIIVDKKSAKKIQNIADEYLFDSKVLVKIVFPWEIEEFAKLGIDGVLLRDDPF